MREAFKIFQPQGAGPPPVSPPFAALRGGAAPHRVRFVSAPPSFTRHGPPEPVSPVILSVPHAGRDYPLPLRAALCVPLPALLPLEDRHADTLALDAADQEQVIVAHRARAWIDLNRAEHERDSRIDEGAAAMPESALSAKLRSGLGLVPRRASGADLWRRRFTAEEIHARIVDDHRHYHETLAGMLAAARARFGIAILLDIHSMPPLASGAARIVIGDRFGRSAASRFVARIEGVAHAARVRTAVNTPYAGGHILERHGNVARDVHAIQIEIDRTLYLDRKRESPGAGFGATAALLRQIVDAVTDEAMPLATAAE